VALEQRCKNGHYYDTDKHTSCPYCGIEGLDIGKTVPRRAGSQAAAAPREELREPRQDQGGKTVGIYMSKIGIDPPVGWLVCIDGPNRGMDYRIRSENNSLGRSETMRICIDGDNRIAKENHAFVSYDPESNTYMLLPGSSKGLVYLNHGVVSAPVPLRPFDEIKVGETVLLFVPLCGEFGGKSFRWA
jgi:FHA domain